MTQDVNVVLFDFHHKNGKEMVVENEDGSFTILINSRLSYSSQLSAYHHAMRHIEADDFQKENVQAIESAAHDMSIPDNVERIPAERYVRRLNAIRARRRKLQRQLKELESDMEFLGGIDPDAVFSRAEQQWLWGEDL